MRQRSWWGWGWADAALDDAACEELAATRVRPYLPLDGGLAPLPAVPPLRPPRIRPLDGLPVRSVTPGTGTRSKLNSVEPK